MFVVGGVSLDKTPGLPHFKIHFEFVQDTFAHMFPLDLVKILEASGENVVERTGLRLFMMVAWNIVSGILHTILYTDVKLDS